LVRAPPHFWSCIRLDRQMTRRERHSVWPFATRLRGTRASGLMHTGGRAAKRTCTTSSMNRRRHPASRIAERHTVRKFRTSSIVESPSWTDVDREVADTMSSYWVNFAAKGDPNRTGLPVWPVLEPNANERLILGPKIEVGPGLDSKRAALFDAVAIRRSAGTSPR
jgi:hypothetical protein